MTTSKAYDINSAYVLESRLMNIRIFGESVRPTGWQDRDGSIFKNLLRQLLVKAKVQNNHSRSWTVLTFHFTLPPPPRNINYFEEFVRFVYI